MFRPGYYCPTPAVEVPCPPGTWCSQATVAPTTCEYPVLMKRYQDMTIPDAPLTVVQRVYAKGEPLGGNICPPVSLSASFGSSPVDIVLCTALLLWHAWKSCNDRLPLPFRCRRHPRSPAPQGTTAPMPRPSCPAPLAASASGGLKFPGCALIRSIPVT